MRKLQPFEPDYNLHLFARRAKYHFVSTMGSLLRHLQRTHEMFRDLKVPYEKAEHLRTEGKDLRDMIEHADEYLGGEGRKQATFVREATGVAVDPGTSRVPLTRRVWSLTITGIGLVVV